MRAVSVVTRMTVADRHGSQEDALRQSANGDGQAAESAGSEGFLRFIEVKKSYDRKVLVVKGFDLDVAKGEFITLLGPSGSGKTTVLMLLAGFESVTGGDILLRGAPITRTAPNKRNIGIVFQNYALFPHMTVAENLAYPLKARKVGRSAIKARVEEYLSLVELGDFGNRHPSQLSGGQRQRVALARALIFEPSLVLMDEPLGALDKKLREQMQFEITRLHQQLGFTVIYVTHDQTEALTMSDRMPADDPCSTTDHVVPSGRGNACDGGAFGSRPARARSRRDPPSHCRGGSTTPGSPWRRRGGRGAGSRGASRTSGAPPHGPRPRGDARRRARSR